MWVADTSYAIDLLFTKRVESEPEKLRETMNGEKKRVVQRRGIRMLTSPEQVRFKGPLHSTLVFRFRTLRSTRCTKI